MTTIITQIGWGTTIFWLTTSFSMFVLYLVRYWLFD